MMKWDLDDGFGGVWEKCWRHDCGLEIVRPGKVQCCKCLDEAGTRRKKKKETNPKMAGTRMVR